jgi:hypothetical protein
LADDLPEKYLRDVSAVAGLSHEAKRSLLSVGGSTVAQLAGMGAGIGRMDGAGWSLAHPKIDPGGFHVSNRYHGCRCHPDGHKLVTIASENESGSGAVN